jgi:acyl-CoA synthetase (AMP-forming)/AMP-acid ligase II
MAELRLAAQVYEETTSSVAVHWVPLYHGMGLVCSILRPLYSGYTSVIVDSVEFLRRPLSWLEQLSAWRASHTSSPTFGYAFTAATPPDPSNLDLSSLRVARVSSEIVPHSTLRDFAEQFMKAGFAYSAFCPSYGLVEAMLAVTSCPVAEEPRLVTVSKSAFREGIGAVVGDDEEEEHDVLHLISSGPPLPETTVRIWTGPHGRSRMSVRLERCGYPARRSYHTLATRSTGSPGGARVIWRSCTRASWCLSVAPLNASKYGESTSTAPRSRR